MGVTVPHQTSHFSTVWLDVKGIEVTIHKLLLASGWVFFHVGRHLFLFSQTISERKKNSKFSSVKHSESSDPIQQSPFFVNSESDPGLTP